MMYSWHHIQDIHRQADSRFLTIQDLKYLLIQMKQEYILFLVMAGKRYLLWDTLNMTD